MKSFKRILCVALTALLLSAVISAPTLAANKFNDVPDTYWAAASINKMASGGLVNGYNSTTFGPNDNMNIGQLATIICRAKGYEGPGGNDYWAYDAVVYCKETLQCIPSSYGAVTKENYSKPCTRELALHMIVKGLGVSDEASLTPNPTITATDIPDWADISMELRQSVLEGFRLGITVGSDKQHTFNPKQLLTRAHVATMLVRAGWTKAGIVAKPVSGGKTCLEIYNEVKAFGIWEESVDQWDNSRTLTAKDKIYGGLQVCYSDTLTPDDPSDDRLDITMPEMNDLLDYDSSGNLVDIKGNKLNMAEWPKCCFDANGKYLCATAFNYESRMLVKKIFGVAYPTMSGDALSALKDCIFSECYEDRGYALPSACRWYDGRLLYITMGEKGKAFILIGAVNDKATYDAVAAETSSKTHRPYNFYSIEAYELNKW